MNAIQATNLCKQYGALTVVDSINFTVEKGTLFSLLGVNGAGKTTTIKMLACILEPTSGDAFLLEDSIVSAPEKVKAKINLSPQETAVAPNLTVFENLVMIAGIYGISPKQAAAKAAALMAEFSLESKRNARAKTLSGGFQRRLSIAMALISEPSILFLDEPTLGLDVLARRELWAAIEKLKGKITIVLTTHYMEEAETLSDRVAIMSNGNIKAMGTPEELMRQAQARHFEDAFIYYVQEGCVG